ncbi:glycosyl hydrolase 53 family protein [Cohnella sp. GCM10027633]|uniref:glycosyl hydrolase 53 family protein n=1 Tax=unclassified Cohnella TaxID=2636738 RepID=UPI00363C2185
MLSSNRTSRWFSSFLAFTLVFATIASLASSPDKADAAPVNLVVNAGYEDAANVWTDWTYAGTASSLTTGSGAGNVRGGTQSINYYNAGAYNVSFTQTLTGLPDGEYMLKAWASGGTPGATTINLFADEFGGTKLTAAVANDGWGNWHQYTVGGIQVVGGQARIGFEIDAPAGVWGYFDDFEFYKVEEEEQSPTPWDPSEFVKGADISTLQAIEDAGGKYYDNGVERDLFAILKDRGVNYIRLRTWVDPVQAGGYNDKAHTVALAKRVKEAGFKLLLDFHYSDFWTDPGQQHKPAAWAGLSFADLKTAMYDYTADVLNALEAVDAYPDMVQIGNEINPGMMVDDTDGDPNNGGSIANYDNLAQLLSTGIEAVHDTTPAGYETKTMIHLAEGGNKGVFESFFDAITSRGVDFDVIGLSFYPYWHGTYKNLKDNLDALSARYNKPLIVVETAHPQTLADGDGWGNIAGADEAETAGFPATTQGQFDQFTTMLNTVAHTAGGMGAGVFYWEPAWIPVPKDAEGNYQAGWRINEGNAWDNQAMFDVHGNALSSLDAFRFDATQLPAKTAVKVVKPNGMTVSANVPAAELSAALPATVGVLHNEGSIEPMPVIWEAADQDRLSRIGTFTLNGTVTGTALTASIDVTVTSFRNLAANPGFEAASTPVGWTVAGSTDATKVESSNAYSGSRAFNYWLETDYAFTLTQTITDLPDGLYTLRARTVGEGGETTLRLFADGYGGDKVTTPNIVNTAWDQYGTYAIEHIHVTNGQATIGFEVAATGGTWGRFDGVEFYREVAVPAWTPQASLTASEPTTTSVKLQWSGVSDAVPAIGYKIYRDGQLHATVTGATYTVTGLQAGQTYAFKVEASADGAIWTSDGPSITASTLANAPPSGTIIVPPQTPGIVTVQPGSLTPDAGGQAQVQVPPGTTEIRLPANAGELIGAGKSLVVNDGSVAMEVPADVLVELQKLASANGGHIAITIGPHAAPTDLLAKAKQATGADIESVGGIYDFGLAYVSPSGERKTLSAFGEPISLTFPVGDSFDPNRSGIFYIADDGELTYVGGKLINGVFTATASHFSAYAVLQVSRSFADVPANHWAEKAIASLASKLIVSGTGDDKFEPGRAVTRAEFATMLFRALRLPATTPAATPFADVPQSASYAEAVNAVHAIGVVNGMGTGNTFEPNRTITRQEMAAMLLRAYDYLQTSAQIAQQPAATDFADADRIAGWAKQAVERAASLGLLQGRGGNKFAPEATLSRAEAAQAVAKLPQP